MGFFGNVKPSVVPHLRPSLAGGSAHRAKYPAESAERSTGKGSRKVKDVTGDGCLSAQHPSWRPNSKFQSWGREDLGKGREHTVRGLFLEVVMPFLLMAPTLARELSVAGKASRVILYLELQSLLLSFVLTRSISASGRLPHLNRTVDVARGNQTKMSAVLNRGYFRP